MQVTLCDYDFTELYEEQLAEFTADQDSLFQNYIAPGGPGGQRSRVVPVRLQHRPRSDAPAE